MSGIYIKGVKMPVGEDEGILIAIYDGKAHEIGTKRTLDAIELPPHGRLIDADLMKTRMGGNDEHQLKTLRDWIDVQPTVIEAEGDE